jgi:two-component system, NtrC family, response regulator AtoC
MPVFFFGSSAKMQELERQVPGIIRSRLPVFVSGERGTGKRSFVEHLHELASHGPFLPVQCSDASLGVLRQWRRGDRRTVFLHHVDRLAPQAQEELLTLLDQMPDQWILSSGLRKLGDLVKAQTFLPELYHRLSAYTVELPPLRERSADLPGLFENLSAAPIGSCPAELMEAFRAYCWPGNVRELGDLVRKYAPAQNPQELMLEMDRRNALAKSLTGSSQTPSLKTRVRQAVKGIEAEIILHTLQKHHWNRRRTAQSLQISYRALLYKMKNCGIGTVSSLSREDGLN